MPPASTTAEQKRPNAIHLSPAGISTQIPGVETPVMPTPEVRVPRPGGPLPVIWGFLFWPRLLLERTEHERNKTPPNFPLELLGKYSGNPRKLRGSLEQAYSNAGIARQPQCRTTGLMRPEWRSLSRSKGRRA